MTPPAIASGLIKEFREDGTVGIRSMFGVLCLYLLIGLIFAVTYATIQDVSEANTEALVGQLYLVTVVAVLISNLRPRRAPAPGARSSRI
jgi:hypothetical protein